MSKHADATMIFMGGIGSGIFVNLYLVARQLRTPMLILGEATSAGICRMLG